MVCNNVQICQQGLKIILPIDCFDGKEKRNIIQTFKSRVILSKDFQAGLNQNVLQKIFSRIKSTTNNMKMMEKKLLFLCHSVK